MATYEQALRDCLLDSIAILETASVRWEADAQRKAVIRDARNLLNREDVANYDYRKGSR